MSESGEVQEKQKVGVCHQCHQPVFIEAPRRKCDRCSKMWCLKCLDRRYGQGETIKPDFWACPVCSGNCNCSVCLKRKGFEPTGRLYEKAKDMGFGSVAEYLQKTEGSLKKRKESEGESESESEPKKKKRKKESEEVKKEKKSGDVTKKKKKKEEDVDEKTKKKQKKKGNKKEESEEKDKGEGESKKKKKRKEKEKEKGKEKRKEKKEDEKKKKKKVKRELTQEEKEQRELVEMLKKEEEAEAEARRKKEEEEKLKRKFPMEDKLLEKLGVSKPFDYWKHIHTIHSDIIASEDLSDLLMIWEFLCNFEDLLSLSSVTLEELEQGFGLKEEEEVVAAADAEGFTDIISEAHMRLLQHVIKEGESDLKEYPVTESTWPEVLRQFLRFQFPKTFRSVIAHLGSKTYSSLSVHDKVRVLSQLCDSFMETDTFRNQLSDLLNEQKAISKNKYQTDTLLREKKKKKKKKEEEEDKEGKKDSEEKELNEEEEFKGMSRQEIVRMKKQKQEEERKEMKRKIQEEKEELANEKKKERLEQELTKVSHKIRTKPLGYDRYRNRYWCFRGHVGIAKGMVFVEKQPRDSESREKARWGVIASKEELDTVMKALNDKGIRERALKKALEQEYPNLERAYTRNNVVIKQSETESNLFNFLREKMEVEVEDDTIPKQQKNKKKKKTNVLLDYMPRRSTRIRRHVEGEEGEEEEDLPPKKILEYREAKSPIGNILLRLLDKLSWNLEEDFSEKEHIWRDQVTAATTTKELVDLLLQLYSALNKEEEELKTSWNQTRLESWREDVEECKTNARLTLLILLFEGSLQHKQIIEKLKCHLCESGEKEEKMLLCDRCDLGFHIFCLRPPLKSIPRGKWYCTFCK